MNQPLPPTTPTYASPNAELAAEIAQALQEAGLINEDDLSLCEKMLNGTTSADAQAWKVLLETPLYTTTSVAPDAV